MKILAIIIFLFVTIQVRSQETDKIIQKGNELYKQQQYDKAEATYKEVLDKEKGNTTAKFNQANALYRQSKQVESVKALDELVMNSNDAELKSKGYYNKGVIFSGQKRLEESIEAYKNALRQNPNDKDARENLQKALMELKKKTPPPPKKDDKKKQQQKQQQKQQPQPKMNEKEAEQRLKLLEQKEKELQQRLQKEKSKGAGGGQKDW